MGVADGSGGWDLGALGVLLGSAGAEVGAVLCVGRPVVRLPVRAAAEVGAAADPEVTIVTGVLAPPEGLFPFMAIIAITIPATTTTAAAIPRIRLVEVPDEWPGWSIASEEAARRPTASGTATAGMSESVPLSSFPAAAARAALA